MRYNAKDKSHNNKKYISTYITSRGGGTLFFFIHRLGPSIYCSTTPPPPPQKKKELSGMSSTLKIFEILATPKNIPILYLDPKKKI